MYTELLNTVNLFSSFQFSEEEFDLIVNITFHHRPVLDTDDASLEEELRLNHRMTNKLNGGRHFSLYKYFSFVYDSHLLLGS